jgi:hypothetical protein
LLEAPDYQGPEAEEEDRGDYRHYRDQAAVAEELVEEQALAEGWGHRLRW